MNLEFVLINAVDLMASVVILNRDTNVVQDSICEPFDYNTQGGHGKCVNQCSHLKREVHVVVMLLLNLCINVVQD